MKTNRISKLCMCILLMCVVASVMGQTRTDLIRAKEYFKNNISSLDPIEGVYEMSMSSQVFALGRAFPPNNTFETIFIQKIGNNRYAIGGQDGGAAIFSRIGESNQYRFTQTFKDYSMEEWVTLYNGTTLDFKLNIPKEALAKSMGRDAAASAKCILHYKLIKTYPTKEMYWQAEREIKEREEESKIENWSGTGFALNNGYIVTNYHVVEDAKSININGVNGNFDVSYSASVVATDKINDLAILKINDSRFKGFGTLPYKIKTSTSEVGEEIFVLGYPLTSTMGDEIKLTTGVISSKTGFQGDVSLYQISAPIQPGNSGGPLFDNKGYLVGIVNAKHMGAENVGYAIKSSNLLNLIESSVSSSILPTSNSIYNLPLTSKVKAVKNFVFMIKCSSIANAVTSSIASANSSNTTSKDKRTIYNPSFDIANSTANCSVKRVSIANDYTAIEIVAKQLNNADWYNISAETYISVNGRYLKIVRAEGIGIAPQRTYFFNNEETFTLFFPPISAETSMISLIEPWRTDANALRIYGIKLQ